MTCIVTGAKVFFEEYRVTHPADVYAVGNCIVIRIAPGRDFYDTIKSPATHAVQLFTDCFMRKHDGIFVVPSNQFREL
jgi:hypothetical protein